MGQQPSSENFAGILHNLEERLSALEYALEYNMTHQQIIQDVADKYNVPFINARKAVEEYGENKNNSANFIASTRTCCGWSR